MTAFLRVGSGSGLGEERNESCLIRSVRDDCQGCSAFVRGTLVGSVEFFCPFQGVCIAEPGLG